MRAKTKSHSSGIIAHLIYVHSCRLFLVVNKTSDIWNYNIFKPAGVLGISTLGEVCGTVCRVGTVSINYVSTCSDDVVREPQLVALAHLQGYSLSFQSNTHKPFLFPTITNHSP
jgi:hypothetical protein